VQIRSCGADNRGHRGEKRARFGRWFGVEKGRFPRSLRAPSAGLASSCRPARREKIFFFRDLTEARKSFLTIKNRAQIKPRVL
jgi:hypothetical protein